METTTIEANNIANIIRINDKEKPPVPTPIPIYAGKKGIKNTNRKYAFNKLNDLKIKKVLAIMVKTEDIFNIFS